LSRGPDFYAAFARDKPRWYGQDPVHPNVEGMLRMAALWHDALTQRLP
jgi:lysophospholipase L1-like esterase